MHLVPLTLHISASCYVQWFVFSSQRNISTHLVHHCYIRPTGNNNVERNSNINNSFIRLVFISPLPWQIALKWNGRPIEHQQGGTSRWGKQGRSHSSVSVSKTRVTHASNNASLIFWHLMEEASIQKKMSQVRLVLESSNNTPIKERTPAIHAVSGSNLHTFSRVLGCKNVDLMRLLY